MWPLPGLPLSRGRRCEAKIHTEGQPHTEEVADFFLIEAKPRTEEAAGFFLSESSIHTESPIRTLTPLIRVDTMVNALPVMDAGKPPRGTPG